MLVSIETGETYDPSQDDASQSFGHHTPTAVCLNTPSPPSDFTLTAEKLSAHTSEIKLNKSTTPPLFDQQRYDGLSRELNSLGVELPDSIMSKMLPSHDHMPLWECVHTENDILQRAPVQHESNDLNLKASAVLILDGESDQDL